MKRSKFTEEQITYALRQHEAGTAVEDICRQLGVSQATFYVWKILECLADDGSNHPISMRVERDRVGYRRVTSPSGRPDPEAFLWSLREDFALLDYRMFVRFMDDTPLSRGRPFSALLGLSAYSRSGHDSKPYAPRRTPPIARHPYDFRRVDSS